MKKKNLTPVCLLVVFSLLMILPLLLVNQLGVHSDWSFHAARVQQIYENIKQGTWLTYIGTNTFSKVGNANFIFYPSLFLYPWALLKFWLSPITSCLVFVWILYLSTLLIAYYCMLDFSDQNQLQSFLFAIIYTIVPYHLYLTVTNYVLGEAQAYTFLPIVLLGMYRLLQGRGWKMLGIGMALEFYCHIVDTFISVEVCLLILICWIIYHRSFTLKQFVNLCKSVVLFLLLGMFQITPLITDYFHQNLQAPPALFTLVQSAGEFITTSIDNQPLNRGGLGLLLILTLLLGWHWLKKNTVYQAIYILGGLLTVMITSAFPWQYFKSTPLAVIQFPYRYTSFAACFLSVVLAAELCEATKHFTINKVVGNILIIAVLIGLYGSELYPVLSRNYNGQQQVAILKHSRHGKYRTLRPASDTEIIINNQSYNKQFSYGALYGETDYMPIPAYQKYSQIFDHVGFINDDKRQMNPIARPNKLIYKIRVDKNSSVDIPALVYRHTTLNVDNQSTTVNVSKRGTVMVHLKPGVHHVTVGYKPSKLYCMSLVISCITWICLLCMTMFKHFKQAK